MADDRTVAGKLHAMVVMPMAFVVSAPLLTYIDRLAVAKKVDAGH